MKIVVVKSPKFLAGFKTVFWNQKNAELTEKIKNSAKPQLRRIFYAAMYHLSIVSNLFQQLPPEHQ